MVMKMVGMSVCLSICTPMVTTLFVFGCDFGVGIKQSQAFAVEIESKNDSFECAVSLAHAPTCAGDTDWTRVSG